MSLTNVELLVVNAPLGEPQYGKTYLLTYASNEASDQPAQKRSLIKVFVGRMKKLCILGYRKCARSVDSDQPAQMRGLIWIFARRTPNGTFSDDVAQLKFHGLLPEIILSVFLVDRLDEMDTFWIDMPFWAYKQDTDFVKTLLKWKIVSNKLHLLTQWMYVITHFRIDASNWRWYGTMIRLITSRNNRFSDKPRTTHSTINTPQTVITLLLRNSINRAS